MGGPSETSTEISIRSGGESHKNDLGAKRNVHQLVLQLLEMYQTVFFKSNIENIKRLSKLTNTMRNFVVNIGKKNANSLPIKETIDSWSECIVLNTQVVLVRIGAL